MDSFFNDIFNALSGEDFEEKPVEIETFVTSEDFLHLPPLSDLQYQMIRAGSQIYKRSTLVSLYGEEKADKRWKQTCNEVILQLGKGTMSLDTDLYDSKTGCWAKFKDVMESDNTVATLNRKTGEISSGYATEVFHSVTEETYEVTTSKGFKFKVNAGHKFVGKGFAMQPLFELSEGDRIAVPTNLPVENEVPLDEREIKLIGYWLGDGMMPLDIPRKRVINMDFSENDREAMKEYIEIHRSYGDNPTVTKHKTKKMWFVRSGIRNSPATLEIARKHGLWGKRAHDKVIPDAIWSLPTEQVSLFLSRLWGTDGCVYLKRCGNKNIQPALEYATISEELATGIQRLLARVGVIAGLRSRIPTYTYLGEKKFGQEAYYLTISDGPGYLRFHKSVTMLDKDTSIGAGIIENKVHSYPSRYEADVYWDSIKSIEGVGTEELFTVTAVDHANYVADMVLNGNSGK